MFRIWDLYEDEFNSLLTEEEADEYLNISQSGIPFIWEYIE